MSERKGIANRVAAYDIPVRPAALAILWDLENLQATAFDVRHNKKGAYGDSVKGNSRAHLERFLRLGAVTAKLRRMIGPVVVNRAYADWGMFKRYNEEVIEHAILPCHVPQLGGMKNAADIRLAIEATEILTTHPHVTHFVIASNDCDFCPVAQHLRMCGKTVIGLGIEGATVNRLWKLACDEFLTIPPAAFDPRPAVPAAKPKPAPPVAAAPVPRTLGEAYRQELATRFHVPVPPAEVRLGLFELVARGYADRVEPSGPTAPALDAYLQHLFAEKGAPIDARLARGLRQLLWKAHILQRTESRWELPPGQDPQRMENTFREWARAKLTSLDGPVENEAFEQAMTGRLGEPAAA